jgi:hypothetical protein
MEVAAVAKAISGLVQSAKTLVAFISNVKDAKNDHKELLSEITATRMILEQLQSHALEDNRKLTMELLGEKAGLLEQLKTEMESLGSKVKPRTGASFVWHFIKDDAMKHAETIHRIRDLLDLALQNDLAYILSKVHI